MQIVQICIILVLLAEALIGAAEIKDNGSRFKLFKRKPSAGKFENVQGSERMSGDMHSQMMTLFKKKQPPIYVVVQPPPMNPTPTYTDTPSTPSFFSPSNDDETAAIEATEARTEATTESMTALPANDPPPPATRSIDDVDGPTEPNKIKIKNTENGHLDDDEPIVFELDDSTSLEDDENDEDEDILEDDDDGDSMAIHNFGVQTMKHKNCDHDHSVSSENLMPADHAYRQDEIRRQRGRKQYLQRQKYLKRQRQIRGRKRWLKSQEEIKHKNAAKKRQNAAKKPQNEKKKQEMNRRRRRIQQQNKRKRLQKQRTQAMENQKMKIQIIKLNK